MYVIMHHSMGELSELYENKFYTDHKSAIQELRDICAEFVSQQVEHDQFKVDLSVSIDELRIYTGGSLDIYNVEELQAA